MKYNTRFGLDYRFPIQLPAYYPDDPGADPVGDPPPPPKPDAPVPPKTFSQAEVEAIVKDRLKRNGGITTEERIELDRLKADAQERERKEAEEKRQYDRALKSVRDEAEAKIKQGEEKFTGLLGEVANEKRTNAILAAASTLKPINADQVVALLKDRVTFDPATRTLTYLGEDGQPGFKNGVPWTAADLLVVFREKNRHLFQAAEGAGSGAQGSGGNSDGGNQNADIDVDEKKLVDSHAALTKAALQSGNPMDITAAATAKRKLDTFRRNKASQAAAGR